MQGERSGKNARLYRDGYEHGGSYSALRKRRNDDGLKPSRHSPGNTGAFYLTV